MAYTKINSKWTVDINMESEKEMLLGDNIGNMFMVLGWAEISNLDIKSANHEGEDLYMVY